MNKTNWATVGLIVALMILSFSCGIATERDRQYSLVKQNEVVLAKHYCENQQLYNVTWTEWYNQNQNKTLQQLNNELNHLES